MFVKPTGEIFYSMSLQPTVARPAPRATDLVVLFDTSASQVGEFRQRGLEILEAMLGSLSAKERVRLLAVDLTAVPLTESFVAPKSEALAAAMTKLRARTPLGSTDMEVAIEAASSCFAASPADRGRAIVYVGDGMSTAQLVSITRMQKLVDRLVD
jgi:hypothetical protein